MMGRRRGIGSARRWFTLKMQATASTETASDVSELEGGLLLVLSVVAFGCAVAFAQDQTRVNGLELVSSKVLNWIYCARWYAAAGPGHRSSPGL